MATKINFKLTKFLFLLLLTTIIACAKPLYQPTQISVPGTMRTNEVKGAILASLNGRGWIIENSSPSEIKASYGRGDKIARVVVYYDSRSVDIRYAGSEGLGYEVGRNGPIIKSKYNGWVMNLEQDIARKISLISASR